MFVLTLILLRFRRGSDVYYLTLGTREEQNDPRYAKYQIKEIIIKLINKDQGPLIMQLLLS